jgi:hypothetical protein
MDIRSINAAERESTSEWRTTLSHIPSTYGQLVYLASLRNPDTGHYEHFGLANHGSDLETSRIIRSSHEAIFQEWVSLSLERKKIEVELYISTIDQVDRTQLLDAWLRLTPYKNLVPGTIQGPERQQHVSDFEAILGLLRNVYGVASPDPSA